MNCKHCGEKVAAFSRYCESCGAECLPFAGWIKHYWAKFLALLKKRVWLTAVVVGVLLVAIGVGVWVSIANRIDVTDYIITAADGYSGSGTISVSIDYDALGERVLGKMPSQDTAKGYEKYKEYMDDLNELKSALSVSADRTAKLNNGDFYIVTVNILKPEVFEKHGVKLKKESYKKTLQVGKDTNVLEKPVEIDIFNYIDAGFVGRNGSGSVEIDLVKQPDTLTLPSGRQIEVYLQYQQSWRENYLMMVIDSGENYVYLNLNYSNNSDLRNGDVVKISLNENETQKLNEYGIKVIFREREYQVTGLTD